DSVGRERELDWKSDAPRHAMHGEHARQCRAARAWRDPITDEFDGRIGLCVEEVWAAQVIVAKAHVGIDALRLYYGRDRRALGVLLVVDDCRVVIVEATANLYRAQQRRGKPDRRVHAVDGIARCRNLGGGLRTHKHWTAPPEYYRSEG